MTNRREFKYSAATTGLIGLPSLVQAKIEMPPVCYVPLRDDQIRGNIAKVDMNRLLMSKVKEKHERLITLFPNFDDRKFIDEHKEQFEKFRIIYVFKYKNKKGILGWI